MFSFSLAIYPGVELLDHIVAVCLVFKGTSILYSLMAAPVYIPTNSVQGFHFLHILSIFVICGLFDDSHFKRHEVIDHCGFDLQLYDDG